MTTAVSLFAGIGGFDLVLDRAGVEVVAYAENDPSCQDVMMSHFPGSFLYRDVRETPGDYLIGDGFKPATGILTAGWPCQGNSVAGSRAGMADPRSGLWAEVVRVLAETRPRWFLGENVPGLLTVNHGRDFLAVVKAMDELGYGVAWRVLDAQYFGVPQRRKRVFIVGCLGDGTRAAEVLLEPEGMRGDLAESGEAGQGDPRAATVSTLQGGGKRGYRIDAEGAAGGHLVTVGTLDAHDGPHGHGGANVQSAFAGHYIPAYDPAYAVSSHHYHDDRENNYALSPMAVRRLTPRECERLQGFPDDWTAGQSDSARYRQLGNAVAVPVAQWIVNRIVAQSTSNH